MHEPNGRFFLNQGGTLTPQSYAYFAVNCWVPIAVGTPGTVEAELIEAMRYEVSRVILANRNSIADFDPIVPKDEGLARHELNGQPRLLRYETTLIGAHARVRG